MMKLSLLTVYRTQPDGTVDGHWLQNHVGTIESALAAAARTNAVNGNRLDIAIVEEVPSPVPMLDFWTRRKRLEK
jgi:hypothetical protein